MDAGPAVAVPVGGGGVDLETLFELRRQAERERLEALRIRDEEEATWILMMLALDDER